MKFNNENKLEKLKKTKLFEFIKAKIKCTSLKDNLIDLTKIIHKKE